MKQWQCEVCGVQFTTPNDAQPFPMKCTNCKSATRPDLSRYIRKEDGTMGSGVRPRPKSTVALSHPAASAVPPPGTPVASTQQPPLQKKSTSGLMPRAAGSGSRTSDASGRPGQAGGGSTNRKRKMLIWVVFGASMAVVFGLLLVLLVWVSMADEPASAPSGLDAALPQPVAPQPAPVTGTPAPVTNPVPAPLPAPVPVSQPAPVPPPPTVQPVTHVPPPPAPPSPAAPVVVPPPPSPQQQPDKPAPGLSPYEMHKRQQGTEKKPDPTSTSPNSEVKPMPPPTTLPDGVKEVVLQDGLNGYAGTRDTNLYSHHSKNKYGSVKVLRDAKTGFFILIAFAIFKKEKGPVPDDVEIVSAELQIYKLSAYDHVYHAHRLKQQWTERMASFDNAMASIPWNKKWNSETPPYAAELDGRGKVDWKQEWLKIDVTAGVTFFQNDKRNTGWTIKSISGNNNAKEFASREYDKDPTLRPKLVVRYREKK